jgi:hypothetical protein
VTPDNRSTPVSDTYERGLGKNFEEIATNGYQTVTQNEAIHSWF